MAAASGNNSMPRPPIVVVMGHVDHGKTTLLDYIRKSNVAAREAGGITQGVSAYEIAHNGKKITFIDTPGHEAFSKMRSRGAAAADLAILVVSAEDSVKPQTQEAIDILHESKTPFVVAINKIDRPGANVEKVKNDLTSANVFLEGYGGQVSYQPISALTGEGVNELIDLLLLAAELENLTYDPAAPASGYVLEARLSKQRGFEVVVIIKDGTLKQGEAVATGSAKGKVKILEDFQGKAAKQLAPSAPAMIVGFESLPQVGEEFGAGEAASFLSQSPAPAAKAAVAVGASALTGKPEETLNVVLKASDYGSLEALSEIIRTVQFPKPVKIVNSSVGEIGDGDAKMAISTGSTLVGFKTRANKAAATLVQAHKIPLITSEIIYDLLQKLEENAKAGEEVLVGELEVLALFNQQRLDEQLVGGKVLVGTFKVKAPFEIRRGGEVLGMGRVISLRQQKKDVTFVPEGTEGGVVLNSPVKIEVGDRLAIKPETAA